VGTSSFGSRARRDAGWSAAWILGIALLALPGVAPAEIVVPGFQATFRWNPASGPVNGYEVWVARNGGAAVALTWVAATEITLTGAPGEVSQMSVRAFSMPDGPNAPFVWGPLSAASEPIRFGGSSPEAFAVLDCPSCSRTDLRLLPGATSVLSVAHPPGGPWDLVHVGKFDAGYAIQIALQQRTSGELFIGDYEGNALVPRANHLEPGFERSLASAADFDGDGLEEILMWDGSTGSLTFWGIQDGYLVRLSSFATVDPSWALIGTQDLNRDGNADLWFDNHNGKVWVYFTYHLLSVGTTRFPMSLTGYTMQDVADYDGNGMPDVLFRKATTGRLTLGLLRGDPNAPTVEFRQLPLLTGDDLLVPQVSVDLDDLPGAEILLQTSSSGSGSVDAVFPVSADPAQRQRLFTTEAGSVLVQVVR
jgi:hypothetical protein